MSDEGVIGWESTVLESWMTLLLIASLKFSCLPPSIISVNSILRLTLPIRIFGQRQETSIQVILYAYDFFILLYLKIQNGGGGG